MSPLVLGSVFSESYDMTCTNPKQGYYPLPGAESTKLIFDKKNPFAGEPVTVPCRGCMSCKQVRAQGRAFLLYAEAYEHDTSCCVTLTYNDDNLPKHGSLTKGEDSDVSVFIRSLRDYYKYRGIKLNIKYFNAGEYGAKLGRPHHHVIIYGYDFPDKKLKRTKCKSKYFSSELLDKLWSKGIAEIGDVTTATCNYVAKYVLKKEFGKSSDKHYFVCDEDTGELVMCKIPEYNTMSKGIGRAFYEKHKHEIYSNDYVTMTGSDFKFKVPEYYDKLLQKEDPDLYEKVKAKRRKVFEDNGIVFTKEDLIAIDKNLRARLALYSKRTME